MKNLALVILVLFCEHSLAQIASESNEKSLGSDSAARPLLALKYYRTVQLDQLQELAKEDRTAELLYGCASGDKVALDALENHLESISGNTATEELAEMVATLHAERFEFRKAIDIATKYGVRSRLSAEWDAYVDFPKPTLEATTNVIELDYDGLRFPAKVGERNVQVVFDTGAPNIGIDLSLASQIVRSIERQSVVPAFKLDFPVHPALLPELDLGPCTLKNLPANGGDVPEEQKANLERLRQVTGGAEVILGLDPFLNFFEVVEFDYESKKIRLIIKADERQKTRSTEPNFIRAGGGKPAVRVQFGDKETNLYVDTGAYGHQAPREFLDGASPSKIRRFEQPWGNFSERLVQIQWIRGPLLQSWVGDGNFGTDTQWGVQGVLGNWRSGKMRIDLKNRRIDLTGYDYAKSNYGFEPISIERIER
ncbi:MAG: hypothetical protein AAF939_14425 [Planctomycetota bacterium]